MPDEEVLSTGLDPSMPANTGLIDEEPELGSWFSGIMSGLKYEVRNSLGDWREYVSRSEKQSNRKTDTMACVTFSHINSIEIQLNFLMLHGIIDIEPLREYLDDTGRFNFSDRYIAKLSGTGPNGNAHDRVANAIRFYGLIPERDWPTNPDMSWNDYYKAVPQHLIDKGQKLLEKYGGVLNFPSEFLPKSWNGSYYGISHQERLKHLLQAPLVISTATCNGWSTAIEVGACSANANHATTMLDVIENDYFLIEDHYEPFDKRLAWDYRVHAANKLVVTPVAAITKRNHMSEAKILQKEGSNEVGILIPMTSQEALYAMGRAMGIEIPSVDGKPNTVDWARLKKDGTYKAN